MGCSGSVETDKSTNQANKQAGGEDNEDYPDYDNEEEHGLKGGKSGKYERNQDNDANLFEIAEQGEGEQFMATKAWMGAMVAPSEEPNFDPSPPPQKLALEYVYGYRAIDSRNNLFYNSNGHAVYMTAAVGIVLNQENNTQTFFGGQDKENSYQHNDDITALTLSPDRTKVATGQVGKVPKIFIWNAETGEYIAQGKQQRNTRCCKAIGWSHDGKFIASLGYDNDHTVHVFNGENAQTVATDRAGSDPMVDLCWSPKDHSFGCAAKRGLTLFQFNGGSLDKSNGLYGSNPRDPMTCVTYGPDGTCYTGSFKGRLFAWSGKSCKGNVQVGKRMINGICATEDKIYVGGDCAIHVLGTNMKEESQINLRADPRAIDVKNGKILVGLRDGSIQEIVDGNSRTIMESHSDGEVWGLDIDPQTGNVITTCDDNKVYVWNPNERKAVASGIINEKAGPKKKIGGASTLSNYPPNQCARSVNINGTNGHVAIGVNNGEVHIRDSVSSLKTIKVLTEPQEWVEVVRYSPDGSMLAVGDHKSTYYVYDVNNNYSLKFRFTKHSAAILAIDWSADSQYIQSNCNAYEILWAQASDGTHLTGGASALRDEKWATHTCKISWPTQGVFPPAASGDFVNGVMRSPDGSLFATGDDQGCVNLFRYPALKGAKCASFKAHSEHVVRVAFSADGARVFSVGGYDRCVMQWRMTE